MAGVTRQGYCSGRGKRSGPLSRRRRASAAYLRAGRPSASPMKFGIVLNQQFLPGVPLGPRMEQILDLVEAARDLGFDSVFASHHYLDSLQTLQPLTLLARIIPVSGSMELGTGVLLTTLAHPVHVAEEVSTLDQLSGGRVILGVGAGYRAGEFAAFGVNPNTVGRRFAESVEALRALWSTEPVTHRGEFFQLEDQTIGIPPAQPGGPPIWIGAGVPATILRAARIGDAWLAAPHVKPRWAVGNLAAFRREARACGRLEQISSCPIIRETYVSTSRARAIGEAERYARDEYRHYSTFGLDFYATMFDDLRDKSFLWGSPDQVATGIADLAQGGFDHLIFRMSWLGMPFSLTMNSLELLAREVLPRFR